MPLGGHADEPDALVVDCWQRVDRVQIMKGASGLADPRAEGIYHLLSVMHRPSPFWLVGAGASARVVPIGVDLQEAVLDPFVHCGVFGVTPTDRDPTVRRIVHNPAALNFDHPYGREFVTHVPQAYVAAKLAQLLSPEPPQRPMPEYALLASAQCPSTFFVMNLDGLAIHYLGSRHHVLEPHGRIPSELVRSEAWSRWIECTLHYGGPDLKDESYVLPQSEPRTITGTKAYERAIPLFALGEDLVVLGYSFGKFQGRIDDSETFEYIVDLARWRRKRLLVIDRQPSEVLCRIQDAARLDHVESLEADWDCVAAALLEESRGVLPRPSATHAEFYSKVLYRHDVLRGRAHSRKKRRSPGPREKGPRWNRGSSVLGVSM